MTVAAPHVDYDGRRLVASHGSHEPRRIVVHDTEGHDVRGIGDLAGIATYWHGVTWGPGAHVGVDAEGYSARYVDDLLIGYHVENHNTGSLGIEQVGFASFTLRTWRSRPAELEECARWCAHWCSLYRIPARLDVEHGISSHAMQSLAYHGSHTDPGRGYPLGWLVERTNQLLASSPAPHPKPQPHQPDPFYLWLRWRLGEGEFKRAGAANPRRRPKTLPAAAPAKWWKRAERFLAARAASSLYPAR